MRKLTKKQLSEMKELDGKHVEIFAVLVGGVWYESEADWSLYRGTCGYPDMDWTPTHKVAWTWKLASFGTNEFYAQLYRDNLIETEL